MNLGIPMARMVRIVLTCVVLLLAAATTANAAMTLTAAGTLAGFSLTTYADGFPATGSAVPFGGVGPVGIGFSGGKVIVSSYAVGRNVVFADMADGKHYGSDGVLSTTSYPSPAGIASLDGHIYQALQGS